jgi:hypothetical protein
MEVLVDLWKYAVLMKFSFPKIGSNNFVIAKKSF